MVLFRIWIFQLPISFSGCLSEIELFAYFKGRLLWPMAYLSLAYHLLVFSLWLTFLWPMACLWPMAYLSLAYGLLVFCLWLTCLWPMAYLSLAYDLLVFGLWLTCQCKDYQVLVRRFDFWIIFLNWNYSSSLFLFWCAGCWACIVLLE